MENAQVTPSFVRTRNQHYVHLLYALYLGPVSRNDVDYIADVSNGPAVIAVLRRAGLNILFYRKSVTLPDGFVMAKGVYVLAPDDRKKALDWVNKILGTAGT